MDTTLNNNKNINDFCLKSLMKTKRHISLAHLHLLSPKSDTFYYSFFCQLENLIFFLSAGLTHNIIRLYFFIFLPGLFENSFLFCRFDPCEKCPLICLPDPFEKSSLICLTGPSTGLGPGLGLCRPLSQMYIRPWATLSLIESCHQVRLNTRKLMGLNFLLLT